MEKRIEYKVNHVVAVSDIYDLWIKPTKTRFGGLGAHFCNRDPAAARILKTMGFGYSNSPGNELSMMELSAWPEGKEFYITYEPPQQGEDFSGKFELYRKEQGIELLLDKGKAGPLMPGQHDKIGVVAKGQCLRLELFLEATEEEYKATEQSFAEWKKSEEENPE
jgi:hypothetical protein